MGSANFKIDSENFQIKIDDKEISDIYKYISNIEIEMDDDLASMFRIKIGIFKEGDGLWSSIDDERFMIWKKVTISAGFTSGREDLISGFITHVIPNFDPERTKCVLEIWGMDESVAMDREEKLRAWPEMKDSDIAAKIFAEYGFNTQVGDTIEDTAVIHAEAVSTIIQRETDIRFLKRLALRNGFECYVENNTGYFKRPDLEAPPQPVIAVHFGRESSLSRFSINVNALRPANVAMSQLDRRVKGPPLYHEAIASDQKVLGGVDNTGLLPAGINPGMVYISMNAVTGIAEMSALCQGLFNRADWFISGEGEINGRRYGHVLRPRKTVTIKGIGENYSGVYYVTHVTHTFTMEGEYIQAFRVKRNALMPKGEEDFSASSE